MAFRQREFLFKKKIEKERKTGQKWAGPHDTPRRRNPVFSIYNQLCLFDFIQEKWRRFFIVVVVFLSNPQIHFFIFYFFSFFLTGGGRRPCWQISTQTSAHVLSTEKGAMQQRKKKDGSRKKAENIISVLFLPGSKKTQEAKECNQ